MSAIKTGNVREKTALARQPNQTPLGVPVERFAGFRRVAYAETLDRADLLRHPDCFQVACGLALAGIKQAAVPINLLANQQQGVLRRVKRLMQSQTARSAWGIDLGAGNLKAVRLAWDRSKQQTLIEAAVLIEHAKMLCHAANDAEEGRLISDTLKAFLEKHRIRSNVICVGMPGRKTLCRRIDLPPINLTKASKVIQLEAPRQFPIPLEQLAWDFQFLGPAANHNSAPRPADKQPHQALLMAARQTTTQPLLDAFQRLNARIDLLQPDFVALHNFLVHDRLSPAADSPPSGAQSVAAAVDIGCDFTNVVVSSPHLLWHRGCGVAGYSFTRALVKDFNLTVAQAERLKLAPESAESLSGLYETLSPVFDDLLKEIQRSLTAYAESHPDHPIERIFGLGGGFALHGLFRYLRCGR